MNEILTTKKDGLRHESFLLPEPVASLRMRNYHLQVQLSMAFTVIPRGLTNTWPRLARRTNDRARYANLTPEQRQAIRARQRLLYANMTSEQKQAKKSMSCEKTQCSE